LRVKLAQLSWTYLEHFKKIDEIKEFIVKTRREVEESDKKNPEFIETYMNKYMEARASAGFPSVSESEMKDSFLRYLVEDAKLPEIDIERHLPLV